MRNFWYLIREVMWVSVLAFALAVITVIVAVVNTEATGLILGLGLASVALSMLAQRE